MPKRILILGGGFSGTTLLRELQKKFKDNAKVEITIVSDDNFFLFTPMLPEVASGMLHASDISTPIRTFCKHAQFYHARIVEINLDKQNIKIEKIFDEKEIILNYDYLIFALGSIDNFYGNKNIENNSFTIKTLEDALAIRNHIIGMLESADNEPNIKIQDELSNFVVVGGGFAGVETASEINHFILNAAKDYYKNIDISKIQVILISASNKILTEVGDDLGDFALNSLKKSGIRVILDTKAVDAGKNYVVLDDGTKIFCGTLIWTAGVRVNPIIKSINCEHGPSGRIIVDEFLCVKGFENVFAIGDCAYVLDPEANEPFPPTAQIALREAKSISKNISSIILGNEKSFKPFVYKNKGIMATIGKRNAVALLNGRKLNGFLAWVVWRIFYLSNLPTTEKKIRVGFEWFLDMFFKHSEILTVGKIKYKGIED